MKYILVDRFLSIEKGRSARAVKNVTGGEELLGLGPTPWPLLPASAVMEAMAQVAGILIAYTYDFKGKAILAKIERADFHRPVGVGDRLEIDARFVSQRDEGCQMAMTAAVEGQEVARLAALMACLDLTSDEGRLFCTRQFLQERADLLRVLGVIDLIGEAAAASALEAPEGRPAAGTPTTDPSIQWIEPTDGPPVADTAGRGG